MPAHKSNNPPKPDDSPVYKDNTEEKKWDKNIEPPLGWTTNIENFRVTDGDTVKFNITREFVGRLIDYDAPETYRPKSSAEKEHGLETTKKVLEMADKAKRKTVFIPADDDGQIKDIFSIGARVQIHLYFDGHNVAVELDREGFSKKDDYN